jgi:hypothetical protein
MPFLSPSDRTSAEALEPTILACRQVVATAFLSLRRSKRPSVRLRRRVVRACCTSRGPSCSRKTHPDLVAGNALTLAGFSLRRSGRAEPAAPRCRRSEELGLSKSPCAETLGVKSVSPGSRSHLVPRISSRCAACSPADRGRLEPPCLSNRSRSRQTIHEGLRVRVRVDTRFPPESESLLPRRPTNPWPKPDARSPDLLRCLAAANRPPPKRRPGVQRSRSQ